MTRDIGINASRTEGDGSCPAKECKRTRPSAADGGVGRSEVREGGVGEEDWDREWGLSGEDVRGADEGSGLGELLAGVLV